MKLTPWYLVAIAPIAVAGCSGAFLGHFAVLAVTLCIFVGHAQPGPPPGPRAPPCPRPADSTESCPTPRRGACSPPAVCANVAAKPRS